MLYMQNCKFDYCAEGFKLPNNLLTLDCVKDCGKGKTERNGSCFDTCDPKNDKKINSFLEPKECIKKKCKSY